MRDQFYGGRLLFKKQESESCFILQTTPDIFQTCSDSVSGLSYELFYSAGLTNFICQLSVEVSLVTMPPTRVIKSFFTASSKRSCQHVENETPADEGEVGEGDLIKM